MVALSRAVTMAAVQLRIILQTGYYVNWIGVVLPPTKSTAPVIEWLFATAGVLIQISVAPYGSDWCVGSSWLISQPPYTVVVLE